FGDYSGPLAVIKPQIFRLRVDRKIILDSVTLAGYRSAGSQRRAAGALRAFRPSKLIKELRHGETNARVHAHVQKTPAQHRVRNKPGTWDAGLRRSRNRSCRPRAACGVQRTCRG